MVAALFALDFHSTDFEVNVWVVSPMAFFRKGTPSKLFPSRQLLAFYLLRTHDLPLVRPRKSINLPGITARSGNARGPELSN